MCEHHVIVIATPGGVYFFVVLGIALLVFVLLRVLGYFT